MVWPVSEDNAAGMSEDQLREYVQRLRSSPAEQSLSTVLSELLEVARIKLGRRDARLFIDSCTVLFAHVRPYLSTEVAGQLERALDELRFAQVQAEHAPDRGEEPNDLAEAPPATAPSTTPSTTPSPSATRPAAGPAPPPASKLWIPGRDF